MKFMTFGSVAGDLFEISECIDCCIVAVLSEVALCRGSGAEAFTVSQKVRFDMTSNLEDPHATRLVA